MMERLWTHFLPEEFAQVFPGYSLDQVHEQVWNGHVHAVEADGQHWIPAEWVAGRCEAEGERLPACLRKVTVYFFRYTGPSGAPVWAAAACGFDWVALRPDIRHWPIGVGVSQNEALGDFLRKVEWDPENSVKLITERLVEPEGRLYFGRWIGAEVCGHAHDNLMEARHCVQQHRRECTPVADEGFIGMCFWDPAEHGQHVLIDMAELCQVRM